MIDKKIDDEFIYEKNYKISLEGYQPKKEREKNEKRNKEIYQPKKRKKNNKNKPLPKITLNE